MNVVKLVYKWFLISTIILCGVTYTPIKYVSSDLKFYQLEYNKLIKEYCPAIHYPNQFTMVFGNLDTYEEGVCRGGNALVGFITINKDHWKSFTEDEKYEVVYHELGHCVLNLDHTNDSRDYMYYAMTNLKKEDVIVQTIQSIKDYCFKQRND